MTNKQGELPVTLGFFATPENWVELSAWIESHPREEHIHLYTAACMAWNLCVKYMEIATANVNEPHKPN